MVASTQSPDCPVVGTRGSLNEGRALDGDVERHWQRLLAAFDQDDDGEDPGVLAGLDVLSRAALEPVLAEAVIGGDQSALLRCLHVAIPLWIAAAGETGSGTREEVLLDWRNRASTALERVDDMVFGGRERDIAARLLTDTTLGMAALAFQLGGVPFSGVNCCAEHPPGGVAVGEGAGRCELCSETEHA